MVFKALNTEGFFLKNTNIYVIGDRVSDVQLGLNAGGVGILVPFEKELGNVEKVKKLKEQSRIYIAKDFLDAAKFIRDMLIKKS